MADPIATVIETLSPFIGEHMSKAVVNETLHNMGADLARLTRADLETLVKTLGLGMNVFVGRERSKTIAAELRNKLGLTAVAAAPWRIAT